MMMIIINKKNSDINIKHKTSYAIQNAINNVYD